MNNQHSVATLLAAARVRLAPVSDTPQLDAELLLAEALSKPRSFLYAWPEARPTRVERRRFLTLLARRTAAEPLAYLLGRREFWSLSLAVTPEVLIPRPDTERLVELALTRLRKRWPQAVADLGTGSGAVALALGRERPLARLTATDASRAALAVAAVNAARLRQKLRLRRGDWLRAVPRRRFQLLVSNPPYVARFSRYLRQPELGFEPRRALAAGDDGLAALRAICAAAPRHLYPGGWLLLEHGFDQAPAVRRLLRGAGLHAVHSYRDAAGRWRVSGGRKPRR